MASAETSPSSIFLAQNSSFLKKIILHKNGKIVEGIGDKKLSNGMTQRSKSRSKFFYDNAVKQKKFQFEPSRLIQMEEIELVIQ